MEFKKNPVTGNLEASFQAVLKNIAENVLTNTKGTEYRIVTIQFPNKDGVVVEKSARMYEKNVEKGPQIDSSYLTTVSIYTNAEGNQMVDLVMSALSGAERASVSDFDVVEVKEESIV